MVQYVNMEQNMQGDDIELRLPVPDDLQFIRWLWSDPESMKPVGGPINLTDSQAQEWYVKMIKPGRPTDCYRLIFNEKTSLWEK
ncbi:MAG: hypothetical protein HZB37_08985 [Planctomycetes bacterium]|nr:hypothetical protein [Planctomycetota bacterium]MBI5952647.1 hypothetical protein [Chloroflexota bacterium]